MDNESFKKKLEKASNNNEKPKMMGEFFENAHHVRPISQELKEKMKPANPSKLMSTPEPEMFDRISKLHLELDEKVKLEQAEKAESKQLQIAQTQYLKKISENTDYIANQFKMTSNALIILNNIMARAEVTFSDIQKDVEESKAINAEIFEILAKTHISNEQERLKATESLLTKIQDKAVLAELPANIMAIIDVVTNLPQ
ncbi:hypothetical protein [Staphylococcus xylosus]